MSDEEKLRPMPIPRSATSCMTRRSTINAGPSAVGFSKTWWDYMWVNEPALEKNKRLQFKTIGEIAKKQGKRVIDAFLDLVVEEKLETRFLQAENNIDDEALKQDPDLSERGHRAWAMAARTCSSTAATATPPSCSANGCARSR